MKRYIEDTTVWKHLPARVRKMVWEELGGYKKISYDAFVMVSIGCLLFYYHDTHGLTKATLFNLIKEI